MKRKETLSQMNLPKSTFDIIVLFGIFLVLYVVYEYAELDPTLMTVTIVFFLSWHCLLLNLQKTT